jgi:hypothetical protein
MTAAAFISGLATILAPERTSEIERARIGDATDKSTGYRTDCSPRARIAGHCADGSSGPGAEKAAAHGAIAGIRTAGGQQERRSKSRRQDETRTHEMNSSHSSERITVEREGLFPKRRSRFTHSGNSRSIE